MQEWIADYPECLGEELLIIQKEFDGFNDTNETEHLSGCSYYLIRYNNIPSPLSAKLLDIITNPTTYHPTPTPYSMPSKLIIYAQIECVDIILSMKSRTYFNT